MQVAAAWMLPCPGGTLPRYQQYLWRLVELIDGRVAAASDAWKSAESSKSRNTHKCCRLRIHSASGAASDVMNGGNE